MVIQHLQELLRQPEIKPFNDPPITLFLDISLIRIIKITAHGKAMADALKQLELILLPSLLQNPLRLLPLFLRESMIVLSAGQQQRFCEILKLLVSKSAWVCKGAYGNEAFGGQGVERVWCAEAVAYATVFGGLFAVSVGNSFRPFWHRGSGEAGVLVSPRCVIEARVCGRVIFVFSVFPYRIVSEIVNTEHGIASIGKSIHQQHSVVVEAMNIWIVKQNIPIAPSWMRASYVCRRFLDGFNFSSCLASMKIS